MYASGRIGYQFRNEGYPEGDRLPWYPDRFCCAVCFFSFHEGWLPDLWVRFKDMIRLMCAHPETTRPCIDKVFRFEKAKEAFAYLESQAHVGKVVINVSDD